MHAWRWLPLAAAGCVSPPANHYAASRPRAASLPYPTTCRRLQQAEELMLRPAKARIVLRERRRRPGRHNSVSRYEVLFHSHPHEEGTWWGRRRGCCSRCAVLRWAGLAAPAAFWPGLAAGCPNPSPCPAAAWCARGARCLTVPCPCTAGRRCWGVQADAGGAAPPLPRHLDRDDSRL